MENQPWIHCGGAGINNEVNQNEFVEKLKMEYVEPGETPKETKFWHYRCNNLEDSYFEFLKCLEPSIIEYINIGEIETGEVEKGDHFHVALRFVNSLTVGQVRKILKLNKHTKFSYYLGGKYKHATLPQFLNYCIKNDSRYVWGKLEVGKKTKVDPANIELKNKNSSDLYKLRISKGAKNDWQWFQDNDAKWTLSAEYSKLYAKYFRAGVDCSPIDGKMCHYWVWGGSGTGKSSSVEYLYPNRYKKIMTNEKWDGYDKNYEGHQVVHIDELNSFRSLEKGMEGLDGLKCKVDRNPFSVRKNYGVDIVTIRPKTFIITSNYTPSQLLCKVEEKGFNIDMEASCLNRKFRVLHISQWLRMNRLKCHPDFGIFDMTIPEQVERYNMLMEDKELSDQDEEEFLR